MKSTPRKTHPDWGMQTQAMACGDAALASWFEVKTGAARKYPSGVERVEMEALLADAQKLLVDERFEEYAANSCCDSCLTFFPACVNPLACASSITSRTIAALSAPWPSVFPR